MDTLIFKRKERASRFKEAVHFFHNEIPEERATVMFLILSGDYDILIKAACELWAHFQNRWFIVFENDKIAKPIFSEFFRSKIAKTCGNIFKQPILTQCKQCSEDNKTVRACDVIDSVIGIAVFQEKQSKKDVKLANLISGLDLTLHLLAYLTYIDGLRDIRVMHRFLTDRTFVPPELVCLSQERIGALKNTELQIFKSITLFE